MRELDKLLKDLDSAVAEIKEIDHKVKAKVKAATLEDKKLDRVTYKALITNMPDTSEKTIECLHNIQKTVVKGLQFKSFALSAPSVWTDDPEMYAHLSELTILPLWKPRPRSRNQTPTLDSFGPPGLWTVGPLTCVFLGLISHKLIPRMLTHAVKRAKPKKLSHQMED
ncbi:hypothetical protein DSO57_1018136 [Entomophthora muscae]|uniref:Uncharacterized protein n=1 Tax=Entomophthora muscae TaxID=34485 RepID=A0ACC2U283_9FUNG|nr:hypothetical protein DSO57_1018136 [Entomophthora muscae]